MPIIVLSYLIQLTLIVHVIKTGRHMTWIYILLFFPGLGGAAYFLIELLPELMRSRTARRVIKSTIAPNADLKKAINQHSIAGTVGNTIALANECLKKGKYQEATDLFENCLSGLYQDDPHILLGYAEALFMQRQFQKAKDSLDHLVEKNPDFKSPDGHLLYAKALTELGDTAGAIHELEILVTYYPGPEPAYRLGKLYRESGNIAGAKEQFNNIARNAELYGTPYRRLHNEWIKNAKTELKSL